MNKDIQLVIWDERVISLEAALYLNLPSFVFIVDGKSGGGLEPFEIPQREAE